MAPVYWDAPMKPVTLYANLNKQIMEWARECHSVGRCTCALSDKVSSDFNSTMLQEETNS